MIEKVKKLIPIPTALLLAACGACTDNARMPSLSELISFENETGVGLGRELKDGKTLVTDYEGSPFGEWTLIVTRGEAELALPELARYSCRNDASGHPPLIMTMDAYAEALKKEPEPRPGPDIPPGYRSPTVEEALGNMRKDLKKYSVLVYRYCKEYAPHPDTD